MGKFLDLFKEIKPFKNHLIYVYDRELPKLTSEEATCVLEIGFTPSSLKWWRACYPNADIVVWDTRTVKVNPKEFPYMKAQIIGPQTGQPQIEQGIENGPYDIICDDASHKSEDQIATFKAMWNSVKPGGIYIIEDVQIRDHGGMDVWPKVMAFCKDGEGQYLDTLVPSSKLIIIKRRKEDEKSI